VTGVVSGFFKIAGFSVFSVIAPYFTVYCYPKRPISEEVPKIDA
jgi:hypothetical protein